MRRVLMTVVGVAKYLAVVIAFLNSGTAPNGVLAAHTIGSRARGNAVLRPAVRRLLHEHDHKDDRQEFNAAVGHGQVFKGEGLREGSGTDSQTDRDGAFGFADRAR